MKKSFLFVAAMALTFAACTPNYDVEDKTVATFEEAAITPASTESVLHLAQTGTFESGNFIFEQEVSVSDWGTYYFGNVVSNKTDGTYKDDYDNDKSSVGGAYQGKNFAVWTSSYTGNDKVKLKQAAKVPGMYVCNTPWVVKAILNGDGMSVDGDKIGTPCGEDDFFLLTITGSLEGTAVAAVVLCCVIPFSCRITEEGITLIGGDFTAPVLEDFEVLDGSSLKLSFSEPVKLSGVVVSPRISGISDSEKI